MIIGPVFTRELVTLPRRPRFYIGRAVYVAALLALVATAWLLLTGTQDVRNVGDMARFGAALFQLLAPLQLALALFFSALLAASAVAQEKDRRTLILLLMTRLSNSEMVLGKLLASLLQVFVLLAAAFPLFSLLALLGGVSFGQVARAMAVTAAAALAAGSLGSTLALWREKTFQSLALVILALVFWLAAGELLLAAGDWAAAKGAPWGIPWGAGISPWRAVLAAARPNLDNSGAGLSATSPVGLFLLVAGGITVLANAVAILRVRVWNPSRELHLQTVQEEDVFLPAEAIPAGQPASAQPAAAPRPARSPHAAAQETRPVWNNPILWREVRTWAYGRKVLAIRVAYLALAALAFWAIRGAALESSVDRWRIAAALVPIAVLSMLLLNALAVTSITTERDLGALDLLLVTDLAPPEFIFGKLLGVFYVGKEMALVPTAICIYLWFAQVLSFEDLFYLLAALWILQIFVAMLGMHAGLTYANSRHAVAVSLGTVFFLLVGIATCMRIMISFSGSFEWQLTPFLVFMVGGGVSMFVALGARNPSAAIGWASLACPLLTFVAITSFLQGQTLGVFLVVAGTYAFTTAAMLIPAVYEFDVAMGRSTGPEE